MAVLYLSVGGAAYISADDENGLLTELDFPTHKTHALFVYLGLTQGRRHSRRAIGALFWPDADEKGAANNLRQTIHRIRTMLFEAGIDPAVIDTSAQQIVLTPSTDVVIDALHIDRVWRECQVHTHRNLEQCTICNRRLAHATKRITGAPFAGLTLPDSPEFELWLAGRRTQIVDSSRQILQALAMFHAASGETMTALHYVRQWLALEPWEEKAHALAMQLLAAQGMRTAAIHQFQQCRQVLQDELGVEPDADLQRLHDWIATGGIPPFAAPRLHHAPFVATPLFGRQAEWHALEALLNDPANRLITILGMGGVGKTQLALAASHAMARLFPDGAWYVSLDAVSGEVQFQAELARSLGIALGDGQPIDSQILQFLSRRNLLILLDGFEHLLHVASFLTRLLQRCPGLTLLVTSRARLDLHVERVLPLDGLSVPETMTLRSHDADDSLSHFVHAAQRLTPHFALTPENSNAILEICHLLGGLPLAVELTAAQTVTHSCQYLARELRHNLDLAAANWLDVSPRQRSLRASFDASWRHLTPYLQQVLSSVAVCEGTFTVDAALAIVKATVDDRCTDAGMAADMERLVNSSLLRRTTTGRCALHAVVRGFALEQLAGAAPHQPDREADTRAAHLRYFAAWLQARDLARAGAAQIQWLDAIEIELDNLVAAWGWAARTQDWVALDAMGPPLHSAMRVRGRYVEFARLLDLGLDALHAHTPPPADSSSPAGQLHCQVLARLSIIAGLNALQLPDRVRAGALAEDAARCIQLIGGERKTVRRTLEASYWLLNSLRAMDENNWPQMANSAQQGLALLGNASDRHLRGMLLSYAALAAQGLGQNQLAISTSAESLALLQGEDGDPWRAAGVSTNIAATLFQEGHFQEATRICQESYAYLRQIGDLEHAAIALDHIAYMEVSVNHDAQAATAYCLQALELLRQTGLPDREANLLNSLGVIAFTAGDLPAAREHLIASLRIALEFNLTSDLLHSGAWLAVTLLQLGQQTAQATELLCAALKSPQLDARMRKLLESSLAITPQWSGCGADHKLEDPADSDWLQATAALAGLAARLVGGRPSAHQSGAIHASGGTSGRSCVPLARRI